jgi:hypothetical protein
MILKSPLELLNRHERMKTGLFGPNSFGQSYRKRLPGCAFSIRCQAQAGHKPEHPSKCGLVACIRRT